jgi:hypothetical protein
MHYRRNADAGLRDAERRAAAGDPDALRQVVAIRLRTGLATLQWLAEGGAPVARLLPSDLRLALVRALTRAPVTPQEASLGNFLPRELAARRGAIGQWGPDPGPQDYERAFENARSLDRITRHHLSDSLLYGGGVTYNTERHDVRVVREGYELWIQPESPAMEGGEGYYLDPEMAPQGGHFPIRIRSGEGGLEVEIEGYEPIVVEGTGVE